MLTARCLRNCRPLLRAPGYRPDGRHRSSLLQRSLIEVNLVLSLVPSPFTTAISPAKCPPRSARIRWPWRRFRLQGTCEGFSCPAGCGKPLKCSESARRRSAPVYCRSVTGLLIWNSGSIRAGQFTGKEDETEDDPPPPRLTRWRVPASPGRTDFQRCVRKASELWPDSLRLHDQRH